ncbi:MAG: NfeD family protein [Pseudomonadota bacterium]
MPEIIDAWNGWIWVIFGLVLMILEAVAPGVFLLWFGGAAIVTGLVSAALGIGLTGQFLLFAVLAALSCWLGARYGASSAGESDSPNLNLRGKQYLGRVFPLEEAIVNGRGRVRIGDTTWRVEGRDHPVGTQMRVIEARGASLIVEPVDTDNETARP